MQAVSDDLRQTLDCMAQAHKQMKLALDHLEGTRSQDDMSKDGIAIRQRSIEKHPN